jgi:hypothetical protein
MDWIRLVCGVALIALGAVPIAYNAMIFWATVVRKGRAPSVAPFIGGLVAAGGVACLPVAGGWMWAWVPMVLDWGCLPYLAAACWYGIFRRKGGS